ncbi:MAG: DNA polymerase III subunit alpha, partial [Conexibacteraceae bacterium]|nr:DNA polymerase III subunit alpha [Conexibacteraceae bacterium]
DLEGSVELVIFGDTLEECQAAIQQDMVVLVKGKIDHKEAGRTCLIVQTVERFEPSSEELASAEREAAKAAAAAAPLRIRLNATALPGTVFAELGDVLASFPGKAEVVIELATSRGARQLRLGPGYRVRRSASLLSELASLLGPAILTPMTGEGPAGD